MPNDDPAEKEKQRSKRKDERCKKGNIQRSGQKSVCLLPVLFFDVASSRVRQKRRYKVRAMPPARQHTASFMSLRTVRRQIKSKSEQRKRGLLPSAAALFLYVGMALHWHTVALPCQCVGMPNDKNFQISYNYFILELSN